MACKSIVLGLLPLLAFVALLGAITSEQGLSQGLQESTHLRRRLHDVHSSSHEGHGHGHEGAGHEGGHEGAGHEGGHEGAGHEGGHEGEGEEAEAWSSENLIAIMLFLFIILIIFFVYLVFLNDADIRKAIYTMLSSTMSIFIAVVINTAAFSFLLNQVIGGKGWNQIGPVSFPRGLGNWIPEIGVWGEFGVSALLFLLCELNLTNGIFLAGENNNARCAVRVIGGHLMAFAGIVTFGTLQLKADQIGDKHHYVFVAGSILVISIFRWIIGLLRKYWFAGLQFAVGSRGSAESRPLTSRDEPGATGGEPEEDLQGEMKEAIGEAENDSFSLIFGFLITQLTVWKTTGNLMPLHAPEGHHAGHKQGQVYTMLLFFLGTLLGLAVFAVLDKLFARFLESDDPADWKSAVKECGPLTCLMTSAWTSLVAATWQVEIWLHGTPLASHAMSEVFAAFFLTITAVLCIIIFDRVGDSLKRRGNSNYKPGGEGSVGISALLDKKGIRFIEKVVRKIIEAFGVLVGLSWEKACHGALETVIESVPVLEAHKVYSSLGVAIVLSCYILPAWYKHILPMANKTADDHQTSINVALMHRLTSEGQVETYLKDNTQRQSEFKKALQALKDMENKLKKHLN